MLDESDRRKSVDGQGPQQRWGDRRDSPRILVKLRVRMAEAGGSFEEKDGDVAVGGAYFEDRHLPAGKTCQLRFSLPGSSEEIRCDGEVMQVTEEPSAFGVHVRFVGLPTEAERAIARYIDDHFLSKQG